MAQTGRRSHQALIAMQLNQGQRQQRLHREDAIGRRGAVEGPALDTDGMAHQAGRIKEAAAIAIRGLGGDPHRLHRAAVAVGCRVEVPHLK